MAIVTGGRRPGLLSRLATGLRNTIKTVSVGEAYLARKVASKKPSKLPELGVLQYGTRFRSLQRLGNPFRAGGVRPATGPSVGQPGLQRFKGTGGAFAPEVTSQITEGPGGLMAPFTKLGSLLEGLQSNPQLQSVAGQVQQLTGMTGDQLGQMGVNDYRQMIAQSTMDQMKMIQLQQAQNRLTQMFTTLSNVMKASHQASMNSIKNIKA